MPLRPSGSPMPGVGIMWPTLPGTIAGWAASGLVASCAVPAGGVAAGWAAAVVAGAVVLGGVCAAAGVSPAAAKAIAHPISLIFPPGMRWDWRRECASPIDLLGSIGAGFPSLKRFVPQRLKGAPAQ